MPFLHTLFGSKTPTLASARQALVDHEALLAAAPARIKAAEGALSRVADLSPEQHAAAEAERDDARRNVIRLEAQVADLRAAVADAEKAERVAELRARHEAARKRAAGMGKALDAYDKAAAATAEAAREIAAIDADVAIVNYQIAEAKKDGLNLPAPIPTSGEVFRTEPDLVEPDQTVVDEVWMHQNDAGRWVPVVIFEERGGKMVPTVAGAALRRVPRVIEGRRRAGRRLAAPTAGLCLPASRLGRDPHWPREA